MISFGLYFNQFEQITNRNGELVSELCCTEFLSSEKGDYKKSVNIKQVYLPKQQQQQLVVSLQPQIVVMKLMEKRLFQKLSSFPTLLLHLK